jgi:hypothetical protein
MEQVCSLATLPVKHHTACSALFSWRVYSAFESLCRAGIFATAQIRASVLALRAGVATDGGTDILAVYDGLPPGVSTTDNEVGWRMSLAKPSDYVLERTSGERRPEVIGIILGEVVQTVDRN